MYETKYRSREKHSVFSIFFALRPTRHLHSMQFYCHATMTGDMWAAITLHEESQCHWVRGHHKTRFVCCKWNFSVNESIWRRICKNVNNRYCYFFVFVKFYFKFDREKEVYSNYLSIGKKFMYCLSAYL